MPRQTPIVFAVAGGTASGKTTVARAILDAVGASQIAYLPHDAYYKDRTDLALEERALLNRSKDFAQPLRRAVDRFVGHFDHETGEFPAPERDQKR